MHVERLIDETCFLSQPKFVRRVGLDLVRAFDDVHEATTPELVEDAMEHPVRDRLEQILPRGIG